MESVVGRDDCDVAIRSMPHAAPQQMTIGSENCIMYVEDKMAEKTSIDVYHGMVELYNVVRYTNYCTFC